MAVTKLHVKKDDLVMVVTGKDKGKSGKVLRVLPEKQRFDHVRRLGEGGMGLVELVRDNDIDPQSRYLTAAAEGNVGLHRAPC